MTICPHCHKEHAPEHDTPECLRLRVQAECERVYGRVVSLDPCMMEVIEREAPAVTAAAQLAGGEGE